MKRKEKNKYGFSKGIRKAAYCKLLREGKWSKEEILAKVKAEFGSASPHAFSLFLQECRKKGLKINRRTLLSFGRKGCMD